MKEQQDIWVMIGFGLDYIQGQIENRKLEEEYRHTVVKSRFVLPPEIELKRLKNSVKKPHNRGYFTNKERAIELLGNECEYIQEGGYYTYVLLEKVGLDNIDSVYWPDEGGETWFKLSEDFTKYVPCEKPDWAIGTISFNS